MILYLLLLLAAAPQPPPAAWSSVIGEYGDAAHPTYVLDKDGKLFELADAQYREITLAEAQAIHASRRLTTPQTSATFRVKPLRPIAELRREALAATPPRETGEFRPSDLVEPVKLDPTIRLDIRYATDNNFLSTPVYSEARARLQRPAAEALVRVSRAIRADGFGLLIHDAWRPWYVTRIFWDAVPEEDHKFVADPQQGSRHNRGCAVDLTLYDLKTGKSVEMTGGYDEMSDRSYPNYPGGTGRQRWHRDYLKEAMEKEGFTVYDTEWWHFDYKDWPRYRIAEGTERLRAPQ